MDAWTVEDAAILLSPELTAVEVRAAHDLPPGVMPAALDGVWIDGRGLPTSGTMVHQRGAVDRLTPTGRFEAHDDGAVAESSRCGHDAKPNEVLSSWDVPQKS